MFRIGRMIRSAKIKATTPPKLMPPFHSTAASGMLPTEQTKEITAASGPISGPHIRDAIPPRVHAIGRSRVDRDAGRTIPAKVKFPGSFGIPGAECTSKNDAIAGIEKHLGGAASFAACGGRGVLTGAARQRLPESPAREMCGFSGPLYS